MTRRLILCADDFGLSSRISAAIADLASNGKINATSCMAIMPGWVADQRMLAELPVRVAVGLHVVLTDLPALAGESALARNGILPRLGHLARRSLTSALPISAIRAEIEAQFDRFSESAGRPPDFVDGHQHCHILPQVRQLVIEITARRAPDAWLRDCTDRLTAMVKRPFAIKALRSAAWSVGFAARAAAAGLSTNQGFAGHTDFRRSLTGLFGKFLLQPGRRHLIMCHPGAGDLAGDTIAAARQAEYAALKALPVNELAQAAGLIFDSQSTFTTAQA